ncbi:hypothetical protein [Hydrocoleum sp. CS-953]|nr:hypothetical protein [Hydrocoleum sp. CS-953]
MAQYSTIIDILKDRSENLPNQTALPSRQIGKPRHGTLPIHH